MRCSEFVTAVAMKTKNGGHTPPVHIVASQSKGSAWTQCGQLAVAGRHMLIESVPWVECECRGCREAFLVEKRRRRPGWWGRALREVAS